MILEVVCDRQPLNLQVDDHINDDIVLLENVCAHEANHILSVVDSTILRLQSQHAVESHVYNFSHMKACDYNKTSSYATSLNGTMKLMEKKMMHLLQLGLLCCLPDVQSRPSIRVVKQIVIHLEDTLNTSTTLSNLMPYLPIKRPLGCYPLPRFDSQQIHDNNLHQHDVQTRLVVASMGYEIP